VSFGKNILLVSDHPDDASFLAEVCQVVQANLQLAPNAKEAVDFLSANDCTAIFVDVSKAETLRGFEAESQKRLGLFSDRLQANLIHFISDRELSENREVIKSPLFGNFFQRQPENLQQNGEFYGRFVAAGEKKATHELKNFLSEHGKVQQVVLSNTSQKQEAAEAVRQYLIAAKIPARISNIITNSVDELLMNAMFDAPCDEFGKTLYSATARDQARALKEHEQVTMSIGFDGFYVGVSVADGFGSLDRGRLLNHVSANYRDRDYQIRAGQAGAGLGLATIHSGGGSLIYHCEARVKTEATLLYRAFPSYREFKNQFKFFSAKFYV
jgi:phage-related protein